MDPRPTVVDDYIPETPPIPEEAPPWEDATPLSKPLQEESAFAPAAPKTSSKPRAPKREKADTPYEESSKKPVGNYRLIKGSPMPISGLALDTGSPIIPAPSISKYLMRLAIRPSWKPSVSVTRS